MDDSRLIRGAGAALGIGFAAVLAAAYLMAPPMPVAGTPAPALVHFVSVNSDRLELSWFLASGPALFLGGCFVGVLAVDVWEMGAPRRLIGAGISSAFLAAALLAGAGVSWGLFVYLAPQLNSYPLVLVLAESRHFAEGAVSFPAAASAATLSIAARNFGRSWRAISWLGLTAAVLQLGNGFDDFAADGVTGALGPLAFSALMLWIAVFSVALTVRKTVLAPGQTRRVSHGASVDQRDELVPIAWRHGHPAEGARPAYSNADGKR